MNNAAVLNAATAVNAVRAAIVAIDNAIVADGGTPTLAAALAACQCARELADAALDAAIGADSIDWSPGAISGRDALAAD